MSGMAAFRDRLGQAAHGIYGIALAGPVAREADYFANSKSNNLLPEPGELIKLLNQRYLDQDMLWEWLAYFGIGEAGGNAASKGLWQGIINRSGEIPDIDTAVSLLGRGRILRPQYDWWVKQYGWQSAAAQDAMVNAPAEWSPDQLRVLYSLGFFGDLQDEPREARRKYQGWLRGAGIRHDEDRRAFNELIQPPTYHEVITARNRNLCSEEEYQRWLTLEGFTDRRVLEVLKGLRAEIPSISELIEFSVKNVFSREITERFGYDDEFDKVPSYQIWAKRDGYIGNPTLSSDDLAGMVRAGDITEAEAEKFKEEQDPKLTSWAQAHWRAHWINPSPTQAYSMLQRQRPHDPTQPLLTAADLADLEFDSPEIKARAMARVGQQRPRMLVVPGTKTYIEPSEIKDVELILRANDYVPRFRPALAGLSYNVLRLVDIRRVVEQSLRDGQWQDETIGKPTIGSGGQTLAERIDSPTPEQRVTYLMEWARQQFLDRGQTPESATALAQLALTSGRRAIGGPERTRRRELERRWIKLAEHRFATYATSEEDFYDDLSRDFKPFSHNYLNTLLITKQRAQSNFDRAVRSIRTDYVEGGLDDMEAHDLLARAGMVESGIEPTIKDWQILMGSRRMLETTSVVLKWYNQGLISRDQALTKLQRIGWTEAGALLEIELPPPRNSARQDIR